MIEVLDAPNGAIGHIMAYLGKAATHNRGKFVKIDGAFDHNASPGGAVVQPYGGWANNGDTLVAPATSGDGIAVKAYLMDKLLYGTDEHDVANDAIASGRGVHLYDVGTFQTDQYDTTVTWSDVSIGASLFLSDTSQLTTGMSTDADGHVVRALYLGTGSTFDSIQSARALLKFTLVPQALLYSGAISELGV